MSHSLRLTQSRGELESAAGCDVTISIFKVLLFSTSSNNFDITRSSVLSLVSSRLRRISECSALNLLPDQSFRGDDLIFFSPFTLCKLFSRIVKLQLTHSEVRQTHGWILGWTRKKYLSQSVDI